MGCLSKTALDKGIREYTTRAVNDAWFRALRKDELPKVKVTVSLLNMDSNPNRKWNDWTIGTHGVNAFFTRPDTKKEVMATFLPEVPLEQKWTHEQTALELIGKAGYKGADRKDLVQKLRIHRYTTTTFSLSYTEWLFGRAKVVAAMPAIDDNRASRAPSNRVVANNRASLAPSNRVVADNR